LSVASHSRSMLNARLAKLRLVEVLVGRFRRAKMDRPSLGTVRTEGMVCALPITARFVLRRSGSRKPNTTKITMLRCCHKICGIGPELGSYVSPLNSLSRRPALEWPRHVAVNAEWCADSPSRVHALQVAPSPRPPTSTRGATVALPHLTQHWELGGRRRTEVSTGRNKPFSLLLDASLNSWGKKTSTLEH
jgi:hypothetical protein